MHLGQKEENVSKEKPVKSRSTPTQNNLRSEGAEFLVLGQLLMRDIHSTKAYTRFPGWDILCVNPDTGRQARIQVKSRWATDSGNFLVKNFDCDFVVLVYLNRGYNFGKRNSLEIGIKDPQFWVFPVELLKESISKQNNSGKLGNSYSFRRTKIETNGRSFEDKWNLILDFLQK